MPWSVLTTWAVDAWHLHQTVSPQTDPSHGDLPAERSIPPPPHHPCLGSGGSFMLKHPLHVIHFHQSTINVILLQIFSSFHLRVSSDWNHITMLNWPLNYNWIYHYSAGWFVAASVYGTHIIPQAVDVCVCVCYMDISSSFLTFLCCSQRRGKLKDICINRAASGHVFPARNPQRKHSRLINSSEHRAFKSAYLLFSDYIITVKASRQVVAFCWGNTTLLHYNCFTIQRHVLEPNIKQGRVFISSTPPPLWHCLLLTTKNI